MAKLSTQFKYRFTYSSRLSFVTGMLSPFGFSLCVLGDLCSSNETYVYIKYIICQVIHIICVTVRVKRIEGYGIRCLGFLQTLFHVHFIIKIINIIIKNKFCFVCVPKQAIHMCMSIFLSLILPEMSIPCPLLHFLRIPKDVLSQQLRPK